LISITISFNNYILKYNPMDEKDKIIASLRNQLQLANSKIKALQQEVALLKYENKKESAVNPLSD